MPTLGADLDRDITHDPDGKNRVPTNNAAGVEQRPKEKQSDDQRPTRNIPRTAGARKVDTGWTTAINTAIDPKLNTKETQ